MHRHTNRAARAAPPSFSQLYRTLEQAGLLDEPQVQRLLALYAATPNTTVKHRLAQLLQLVAVQHDRYPFRHDIGLTQHQATHIELGVVKTGSPFTLPLDVLPKHVLVAGETGAGKTTLFLQLMDRLTAHDVPWWSFDLKQDYRHLLQRDPALAVYPWHQLKLNPLQPPPNVSRQRWAQVFAEVFCHAYGLLTASKSYIMTRLMELYDQDEGVPTLHTLADHIAGASDQSWKKRQYHDTVTTRLSAMLSVAGTLFDTESGVPLADLLDRRVVFEFNGLHTELQDLLMEYLFAWVYEYRLANGDRDTGLNHVFFLDEGKRVFSVYKERSDAAGIPHIATVTAKMREFGEALLVADQEPTKLTDSIKANTHTKVLLPVGDAPQFNAIASAMNLSDRQRQYVHSLDVGEAVVKIGTRPAVPVHFHPFYLDKSVTDTDVAEQMQERWPDPGSPDSPASLSSPGETPSQAGEQPDSRDEVSDDVLKLLKDIAAHPFRNLSDRYARFSSTGKAYNVKQTAVDAGFIREHVVEDGGRFKLVELTEEGRQALAERDITVERTGRGGIVHRYWQHRLRDAFQDAGYTAEIEADHADVRVTVDDETQVAVEVAMSAADREVQHVQDRLAQGFAQVVIACQSEDVQTQLQQKLVASDVAMEAVTVHTVHALVTSETGLPT